MMAGTEHMVAAAHWRSAWSRGSPGLSGGAAARSWRRPRRILPRQSASASGGRGRQNPGGGQPGGAALDAAPGRLSSDPARLYGSVQVPCCSRTNRGGACGGAGGGQACADARFEASSAGLLARAAAGDRALEAPAKRAPCCPSALAGAASGGGVMTGGGGCAGGACTIPADEAGWGRVRRGLAAARAAERRMWSSPRCSSHSCLASSTICIWRAVPEVRKPAPRRKQVASKPGFAAGTAANGGAGGADADGPAALAREARSASASVARRCGLPCRRCRGSGGRPRFRASRAEPPSATAGARGREVEREPDLDGPRGAKVRAAGDAEADRTSRGGRRRAGRALPEGRARAGGRGPAGCAHPGCRGAGAGAGSGACAIRHATASASTWTHWCISGPATGGCVGATRGALVFAEEPDEGDRDPPEEVREAEYEEPPEPLDGRSGSGGTAGANGAGAGGSRAAAEPRAAPTGFRAIAQAPRPRGAEGRRRRAACRAQRQSAPPPRGSTHAPRARGRRRRPRPQQRARHEEIAQLAMNAVAGS